MEVLEGTGDVGRSVGFGQKGNIVHPVSYKHDYRLLHPLLDALQKIIQISLLVHARLLCHIITVNKADIVILFIAGHIEDTVPAVLLEEIQAVLVLSLIHI